MTKKNLKKLKFNTINPVKYKFCKGDIIRRMDEFYIITDTVIDGYSEYFSMENLDEVANFIKKETIDAVLSIEDYPEYYL